LTKRVIAFAWAVDPLALSVFFPPQLTLADDLLVVPLPWLALLLSLPHADNIREQVASMLTAAPNRLNINWIPLHVIVARIAADNCGVSTCRLCSG
jgi:hypothetical protein